MQKLIILFLINYEPIRTAQLITYEETSTILDELFIEESSYSCLYDGPIFVTQTIELLIFMLGKCQSINMNQFEHLIMERIHFMVGATVLVLDRIYEYHSQKQIHSYLNSPKIFKLLSRQIE